ncbi:MAG: methionyl-tRNA formyltransferase [Faecalibacterium sp.]|nr:methionyl-tRNA formyltransferase [Faecalibacterium sp.]
MRILFMGTPDIAAACLEALYAAGHEICAVYTRRDKPVGRKQVLTAPPAKTVALAHGTPVYQPHTLRDGGEDENIRALAPDLIVVVAYGCILPASVLAMPKYGCINLHVSLLPKYRGSAPVQWAVLNGDAETGVCIQQMEEGLDTGAILVCEKVSIGENETSGELFDRVTAVGAQLLCRMLPQLEAGDLAAQPQDHAKATMAPMLTKELAEFQLTQSAGHIHNWVRGMNPWPAAWFVTGSGKKVKVLETRVSALPQSAAPGTVLATKPLTIACGEGAIELLKLVPEGSKPMDGVAFAAGQRLKKGDTL